MVVMVCSSRVLKMRSCGKLMTYKACLRCGSESEGLPRIMECLSELSLMIREVATEVDWWSSIVMVMCESSAEVRSSSMKPVGTNLYQRT